MFETRIKNLQNLLSEYQIESLLITSSYNIAYLTGIFAFSNEEREAWILVGKDFIYLFTDARYTEMVKNSAPFVTLIETNAANTMYKAFIALLEKHKISELSFEESHISYKEAADLEEKLPNISLAPTQEIVEDLRMIKDESEIENIRKACALTDKAFEYIRLHIKAGMTEIELKILLESYIRGKGAELAFDSIVAFGTNAVIPHHMSGDTKLTHDGMVLLDFGAKVNGYCSDFTRCLFLKKPSEKLAKIYKATRETQELALEELKEHTKDGFKPNLLQENASSHLQSLGFPAIPHGLGHGVGLQVHESPRLSPFSDEKFLPGVVVTVEPGVYLPNIGGVRIEDTVLITASGIDILTKSSKKLTVI